MTPGERVARRGNGSGMVRRLAYLGRGALTGGVAVLAWAACADSSNVWNSAQGEPAIASQVAAPERVPGQTILSSRPVSVIPRWNQWGLLEEGQRRRLRAWVAVATPEVRAWLVHGGEGPARGLGLFLADQNQDTAVLLSWCAMLDDHRETLPYPLPVASPGPMQVRRQTVSDYLSALYLEWFGVDVDGDPGRCEALFHGCEDPARPVRPWVVRLLRARDRAERRRIVRSILALPDPVRGAVALLAFEADALAEREVCRVWSSVASGVRSDFGAGVPVLPDEPMARAYGRRFGDRLVRLAARLTSACRGGR